MTAVNESVSDYDACYALLGQLLAESNLQTLPVFTLHSPITLS